MERRPSKIAKQQRTLQRLEKKLQKSTELEEKYSNANKEYIDKGYVIKLSERKQIRPLT